MQVDIELTAESRDLLLRHFPDHAPLHDLLNSSKRTEIAGVVVYQFICEEQQAAELLDMARNQCPPAVKDIEHAIDAAQRR